jgi:predicted DNA-binding transcriptional regulator YafY
VAIALQATAGTGGGIEEAGLRALATVRQVTPSRLRHPLDAFAVTVVGRPGDAASADVSLDVLMTLANGIRDRRVLRFDYADRGGDDRERRRRETRRVEPHHLVTCHGRWYLVAWNLERDDWRLFRVDRVDPRSTGGPPFTPAASPAATCTISSLLASRAR